MLEKNKYEKIIDIINEPYKDKGGKPYIYGKYLFTDKALIMLDTPRKEGAYHGSSFVFSCYKDKCDVNGEIIVKRELEQNISDNVLAINCNIDRIHRHPEEILMAIPDKEYEEYEKESHVHFTCANKDYDSTLKIAKLVREY